MTAPDDTRGDRTGAGALRDKTITDIENAISEALSTLAGTPLAVTLQGIDFGEAWFSTAKLRLNIDSGQPAEE
jgi:hypothetical protein